MIELPNPAPVLDLIQAFRRSKTMFTAVSLGVFDRLGDGGADATTLAREVGRQRRRARALAGLLRWPGPAREARRGLFQHAGGQRLI